MAIMRALTSARVVSLPKLPGGAAAADAEPSDGTWETAAAEDGAASAAVSRGAFEVAEDGGGGTIAAEDLEKMVLEAAAEELAGVVLRIDRKFWAVAGGTCADPRNKEAPECAPVPGPDVEKEEGATEESALMCTLLDPWGLRDDAVAEDADKAVIAAAPSSIAKSAGDMGVSWGCRGMCDKNVDGKGSWGCWGGAAAYREVLLLLLSTPLPPPSQKPLPRSGIPE